MTGSETNEAGGPCLLRARVVGRLRRAARHPRPGLRRHPEEARGVEGLTAMVQRYRAALSGLNVTIEHQFSSGDYVATRTTIRGRHEGEMMGAPPTGRDVEFGGLTISRCREGRIEEEWELVDVPALLTQIGVLPEPATA